MDAQIQTADQSPKSNQLKNRLMYIYSHATGWAFLACAAAVLTAGLDQNPFLASQDAVLGFSTRTVLLSTGVLLLGLAAYLLFGKDLVIQGLLIVWIAFVFFAYLLGMLWMKAPTPLPVIILTGWKLGLPAHGIDLFLRVMLLYLAIGGAMIVVIDWLDRRRAKAAAWKKLCEERGWKP